MMQCTLYAVHQRFFTFFFIENEPGIRFDDLAEYEPRRYCTRIFPFEQSGTDASFLASDYVTLLGSKWKWYRNDKDFFFINRLDRILEFIWSEQSTVLIIFSLISSREALALDIHSIVFLYDSKVNIGSAVSLRLTPKASRPTVSKRGWEPEWKLCFLRGQVHDKFFILFLFFSNRVLGEGSGFLFTGLFQFV